MSAGLVRWAARRVDQQLRHARCGEDRPAAGSVGLACCVDTFDQQREFVGERSGVGRVGGLREFVQPRDQLRLVVGHALPCWMRGVRKLRRDVDERAATVIGRGGALREILEILDQLPGGIAGMLRNARLEALEKALVAALQIRDHQIVLRRELPVQAHLVDARAFDHGFDANRAHAFPIEQFVRREQQMLLGTRPGRLGTGAARAHRAGPGDGWGSVFTLGLVGHFGHLIIRVTLDMLPSGHYYRNTLVTDR
ncbi:hypothetical protein PSAC2689_160041 [Paraburkholderia sacchari]